MLTELVLSLFGGLLWAFFFGSIPTGYLVGRTKGMDLRAMGSGNVGATNALRVLGTGLGLFVLAVDVAKGAFAVFLISSLLSPSFVIPLSWYGWSETSLRSFFEILLGSAAIAGHVWNPFIGFKGGKGVATAAGVILVLDPIIALAAFAVFLLLTLLTRYVSLGSIAAALSVLVLAFLLESPVPLKVFFAATALLVLSRHTENLARLRKGTEHKLRFRVNRTPEEKRNPPSN